MSWNSDNYQKLAKLQRYTAAVLVRRVVSCLPSCGVVADFGCGTGFVLQELNCLLGYGAKFSYIGVDSSVSMLECARRFCGKNCHIFMCEDAFSVDAIIQKADILVSNFAIHLFFKKVFKYECDDLTPLNWLDNVLLKASSARKLAVFALPIAGSFSKVAQEVLRASNVHLPLGGYLLTGSDISEVVQKHSGTLEILDIEEEFSCPFAVLQHFKSIGASKFGWHCSIPDLRRVRLSKSRPVALNYKVALITFGLHC